MGIFKRMFGKEKKKSTPFPESYLSARNAVSRLLDQGNPKGAFSAFRSVLDYPAGLAGREHFVDALELFVRLCRGMGDDKMEELAKNAAMTPEDPRALYNLGLELYEKHRMFPWAATILEQGLKSSPNELDLLLLLVMNLEAMGLSGQAVHWLLQYESQMDFEPILRYLLASNLLMTGDIAGSEDYAKALVSVRDEQIVSLTMGLYQCLERCTALAAHGFLDDNDLRGWHLGLNGSLLLHVSDYGADEGMNGRYAYTEDSEERCKEAIIRVQAALKAAGRTIDGIIALPDRNSKILAKAAATVMNLPYYEWGTFRGGTLLIVAYDLSKIEDFEIVDELQEIRPGRILWEHASCWTSPMPFAADLTTYLYQINISPWDAGRLQYDETLEKPIRLPERTGTVEELSAWVALAKPENAMEDLDVYASLLAAVRNAGEEAAPGLLRSDGLRSAFRVGSPVSSSRFS